MPDQDVAEIAGKLTKAQHKMIVASWPEPSGRMLWDLAKLGLADAIGLTRLGYEVRAHLKGQSQ